MIYVYMYLVEYDFYWQHDLMEQRFLQMAWEFHRLQNFHLKIAVMNFLFMFLWCIMMKLKFIVKTLFCWTKFHATTQASRRKRQA